MSAKMMTSQGVGHITHWGMLCEWPPKGRHMVPAPALDLTTSDQGWSLGMVLSPKLMILTGVGHVVSPIGVCYVNDPPKGGTQFPPALDRTTSYRGDFVHPPLAQSVPFGVCRWGVGSPQLLSHSTQQIHRCHRGGDHNMHPNP